ncbi:ankyrin repeat-containing domain protein [Pavlovales sp. CCMP2436]|nr:ankyrin repeat-containing domain protein [Pavlovales sp. CCMP2436]
MRQGDLEALKTLMAADLDLNAGDYDSRRPIHLAACMGNIVAIQMLSAARADVNVKDRYGHTALHEALVHKQADAATLLISVGAECLYLLIADRLCYVASLADGADEPKHLCGFEKRFVSTPNYDGRTGIHLAAAEGRVESVQLLLENGALVNARDKRGSTPLLDAFNGRHKAAAELLLAHGADMGEFETGVPFCTAGASNDVAVLEALLFHRCDPNVGDYDGRCALHLACSNGHVDAVRLLLKHPGVNVNVEDRYGNSPLDDVLRGTGGDGLEFTGNSPLEVVRALLTKKGSKPGSHKTWEKAATESEDLLIAQSRRLVVRTKKHVPAVTGFSQWTKAASKRTKEMHKLLGEVRVLERDGVRIPDAKAQLWNSLQTFSRWYQTVVAWAANLCELLASWVRLSHGDERDSAACARAPVPACPLRVAGHAPSQCLSAAHRFLFPRARRWGVRGLLWDGGGMLGAASGAVVCAVRAGPLSCAPVLTTRPLPPCALTTSRSYWRYSTSRPAGGRTWSVSTH